MTRLPAAVDALVESVALSRITWFAILQIVSLASGFALYLVYLPSIFSTFSMFAPGTTPSPSDLSTFFQSLFTYLSVGIAFGVAIGLIAVLLLLDAFRKLSRLDRPNFSIPATLTLLLLVGDLMAGIGIVPLFMMLSSILSQVAQTPTTYPFAGGIPMGFIGALALLVIGGILAIVGLIGGEILGLWRVGTRYDSTIIKVGAIFVIVPLLNYVGPILLLIGSLEAKKKVGSQTQS